MLTIIVNLSRPEVAISKRLNCDCLPMFGVPHLAFLTTFC